MFASSYGYERKLNLENEAMKATMTAAYLAGQLDR